LVRGRLVILAKNGGLSPITVPQPLLLLAEHICLMPCTKYSGVDTAAHLMQ
jgi:hypothetical protein